MRKFSSSISGVQLVIEVIEVIEVTVIDILRFCHSIFPGLCTF